MRDKVKGLKGLNNRVNIAKYFDGNAAEKITWEVGRNSVNRNGR
jgi:hypothetical protein